jgi:glycine dehydrogenase subunit 1
VRVAANVPSVLDQLADEGLAGGYWLGREYPEYEDGLLVAITERRSREDIDRLADALERAIQASSAEKVADSASISPLAEEAAR